MKKIATKLAVIAATAVISISGIAFADAQGVQISLGYRQDSLKWKMHDHGVIDPRVNSHLHFKDLEILTLGAKYKGLLGCSVYTRTHFDWGWVLDGRVRDRVNVEHQLYADRFGCGAFFTAGEYATFNSSKKLKNSSYVWDFNFGIGTPIDACWCSDLKIAPMIGFSYDRHHLKSKRGQGIFSDDSSSDFYGSDSSHSSSSCGHRGGSSFNTAFWGPWLGFDLAYNNPGCWNVFGEFELHFGRAERERRSSTGSGFLDCHQSTKDFWGPTFRVGGNYIICDCYYLEGTIAYQYWQSYGSRDQMYWSSASIQFDLGYMF